MSDGWWTFLIFTYEFRQDEYEKSSGGQSLFLLCESGITTVASALPIGDPPPPSGPSAQVVGFQGVTEEIFSPWIQPLHSSWVCLFIFFKTIWKTGYREREVCRSFICWFSPRMAPMTGTERIWSKEPGASSWSTSLTPPPQEILHITCSKCHVLLTCVICGVPCRTRGFVINSWSSGVIFLRVFPNNAIFCLFLTFVNTRRSGATCSDWCSVQRRNRPICSA